MAGNACPKFATGGAPPALAKIKSATANTCAHILNLPMRDAEIINPSLAAIERKPETANSRPTMITTAHAGASLFSTSEMSAAEMSNLSAMGSSSLPTDVTCERRRAMWPSK